jgi:hypothetical protein
MIKDNNEIKNYEENRHLINSGDILLCSGKAIFSKMIQKFTNSKWSHVAFIIRMPSIDRIMVLESVESIGVRAVTLSSYIKDYNGTGKRYNGDLIIARHSHMKDCFIENLSKKAVDLLGHPYDSQEIMRISARIAASKVMDLSCEMPKEHNEYICSEYVDACYRSIGIHIKPSCGYVAPSDFANDNNVYPIFGV